MNKEAIEKRIEVLIEDCEKGFYNDHEISSGILSLLVILHGESSPQVKTFSKKVDGINRFRDEPLEMFREDYSNLFLGVLRNMKAEIEAGLIGNFQKTISGEILTDFLKLARETFDKKGDNAKNISAVLAAALFEDTIRRLGVINGIPHKEKLSDVLLALSKKKVLEGAQIGTAQAYLAFRNKALHAKWDEVGRETVASSLSFVEQLLLKYFS
jgi:hypothetical protein